MKFLGSFFIIFLFQGILYAQDNPYTSLNYDSLVIYDFDYRLPKGGRIMSIIDKDGNLASTVKKSIRLPGKEAKELSDKMGLKRSYGQITAACFDPHFGMVYYEDGKVKEFITICMTCNYPRPSLPIPARNQGMETYEESVYYTLGGFSKSFRRYLNNFKKKYGFPAPDELRDPMFD